ncbi:Glycosyl transferase family 2 [Streptomyces sp. DvalAA-14]|uniref:glycosyltransferase n=1 Tax=unclassified Streptomyces TaxID=2593676 RepID=UPI00081B32A4|nr:glycosyltransferase [Streptomyces sp. DvalAA-14]MYS22637.1 glycosyltransferase [Streptomyces sp. SID4948]SCE19697.1 Glycosyl transferase family 2 [Streptomyces sp. DvalAA-14]
MTSIVIPAHNEERVIGRLLDALLTGDFADTAGPAAGAPPDVVVVCNGCTDDTAKVAGARAGVRVVEIPVPSKHVALRTGDEHAAGFPRLYVDADVVLGAADVRALAGALAGSPHLLAAAPERELPLAGCAWRVRAYYRVWTRLPAVREGLFGRGVIAVTERGWERLAALPPLMADDLAASLAFGPGERRVVETARVVVHPPRTWADLIRRRIRAAVSTAQLEGRQARTAAGGALTDGAPTQAGPAREAAPAPEAAPPSARTSTADLRTLLRGEPKLLPSVVVFLAAAVTARRRAGKAIRDQDFGTWLRDESSREG